MFSGDKLKWWNESDLLGTKLNGYFVSHLWYAMEWKDDCNAEHHTDDDSLGSAMNKKPAAKPKSTKLSIQAESSESDYSDSKSDSSCSSQSRDIKPKSKKRLKKNQVKSKKQKKQRQKYPTGLSVFPVSNRGRLPKCDYCCGEMIRHEPHIVFKKTINNPNDSQKSWMKMSHFHLKCFQGLDEQHWNKLLAILENYHEYNDASMFDDAWKQRMIDDIRKAKVKK